MKASQLIIRIPEPCHEDWNNMLPDAKGKFCMSCHKSVIDFSGKTDTEIRDILQYHKDQKVCGHFKKTQIDRPLNITINLHDLPRNMSVTRAFAIALFIVFGTFLFSCTNEQGQKVESIEVVGSDKPEEEKITMGMVLLPPDSLNLNTVSFNATQENVCTAVSGEIYVDGGIELVELPEPVVEQVSNDSTMKEEPIIDHAIVGQMVVYTIEEKDTSAASTNDSLMVKNPDQMKTTDNISKTADFGVYPNPSSGEFTVRYSVLKRANVSLVIYDMQGVIIRSLVNVRDQYEGQYHVPVNLNELPNGIYIVSLINGDKKSTERMVIER